MLCTAVVKFIGYFFSESDGLYVPLKLDIFSIFCIINRLISFIALLKMFLYLHKVVLCTKEDLCICRNTTKGVLMILIRPDCGILVLLLPIVIETLSHVSKTYYF